MIYKKIDISEAALFNVSEDAAKELIEHRINKKSPFTQRAFVRALKQATKCTELGLTPDEAIEMTIDKGWSGVTFTYIKNEIERQQNEKGRGYSKELETRSSRADKQLQTVIGANRGHQH